MKWYELEDKDRIKECYSKFKIQEFWDWWSDKQPKVMEVRIKNYLLVKETGKLLKLPYSPSGVYVNNAKDLTRVIAYVRDKATIWFGIHPRKKNWNKWGSKGFGGTDYHVESWGFIFIDIDRMRKDGVASGDELKSCDILANRILERLEMEKWNKGHIKICSGHGVQLLIKLDFPIKIPDATFDDESKTYITNDDFEKMRRIMSQGIGKDILKFSRKFKEELEVSIDKSVSNLSRVGALPVTKNFKYNTFRWRGIVELKDGVNDGLSDYVLSKEEDIELYKSKQVFVVKSLGKERIKPGRLAYNPIVKFMLGNDLPEGMRNNYLWFQLKCLLRDSKSDMNSLEFKRIHKRLEKRQGTLTLNLPDKRFQFDENIVNSFCIQNLISPIYQFLPHRSKKLNMKLEKLNWALIDIIDDKEKLGQDTDIMKDMENFKGKLIVGDYENVNRMMRFTKGCLKKYGEKKTKYYFEFLFERYFGYR